MNTCIILCGDWNFVQGTCIDTYNILHDRHTNCRAKVQEIIETYNLVDSWRITIKQKN